MNPVSSIKTFVGEMLAELKKAAWPNWAELRDYTIVVIVAVVLLGVFTSISDFSLYQVVDLLTSWAGR